MLGRSFLCVKLTEVSNLILIGYILRILTPEIVYNYYNFISIVLLISSKELSQIYLITEYMMYFI